MEPGPAVHSAPPGEEMRVRQARRGLNSTPWTLKPWAGDGLGSMSPSREATGPSLWASIRNLVPLPHGSRRSPLSTPPPPRPHVVETIIIHGPEHSDDVPRPEGQLCLQRDHNVGVRPGQARSPPRLAWAPEGAHLHVHVGRALPGVVVKRGHHGMGSFQASRGGQLGGPWRGRRRRLLIGTPTRLLSSALETCRPESESPPPQQLWLQGRLEAQGSPSPPRGWAGPSHSAAERRAL